MDVYSNFVVSLAYWDMKFTQLRAKVPKQIMLDQDKRYCMLHNCMHNSQKYAIVWHQNACWCQTYKREIKYIFVCRNHFYNGISLKNVKFSSRCAPNTRQLNAIPFTQNCDIEQLVHAVQYHQAKWVYKTLLPNPQKPNIQVQATSKHALFKNVYYIRKAYHIWKDTAKFNMTHSYIICSKWTQNCITKFPKIYSE